MIPADFVAPLSPAWAWLNSHYAEYGVHPGGYWTSVLLTLGWSWGFLARASAIISRFCEQEGAAKDSAESKSWFRRWRENPERRAKLRQKQLAANPVMWLADHNPDSPGLLWALVLIVGAGITGRIVFAPQLAKLPVILRGGGLDLTFIIFILLMNAAVKTLLAVRACRCLAEVRRNAMLETLLCAPLKVQDILQGQVMALKRRFLAPLMLLMFFEMAALFCMVGGMGISHSRRWRRRDFHGSLFRHPVRAGSAECRVAGYVVWVVVTK